MNKQRSPVEQMLLIGLLSFCAFTFWQQFSGNKNKAGRPEKVTPPLAQAFGGLKSGEAALSKDAALKQIAALQTEIENNGKDEYSYWARLRVGLLQQYVLQNPVEARKAYDEVVHRNKNEAVDAQAVYQKGDLLWRLSQSTSGASAAAQTSPAADSAIGNAATGNSVSSGTATDPSQSPAAVAQQQGVLKTEGAQTLEQILTRSRGHQDFLKVKIFVPDIQSARGDPLQIPAKWEELPLSQLTGKGSTLPANSSVAPDPRAILTRVDSYYSTTPLYKIFDAVVNWFGAQPAYSYGLALIVLALVTRLVMQPLIKKQYDGMKGMQVIAPEMKKIQDKYKGKADQESQMRMMKEIRELQKAHGVNPMGCGLSLVIQMPVFFFIVLPLINHYQARMELSGAHFGWIQSLARPDIPLLALYAISMFISVRLSSTTPTDEQQKQMQRITTIMSPLFALFLWTYPSAFILYWFTYNALSTVLQWRMMKASDPNKDLIKTLMGTAPAPAATGIIEASATSTSSAIPPRPGKNSNKNAAGKNVKSLAPVQSTPVPNQTAALNGASENGRSQNGQSTEAGGDTALVSDETPFDTQEPGGKSSNGASGAARRRRRRR